MNISDVFEELDLHFKRIDSILREIENCMPLKQNDFNNVEIIKTIDSFVYRFIKIQDKMGDKLFPSFLSVMQEYQANMPLIDILNKLEKLEFIESTEQWIEFRKLRNNLTHEYPGNEEEIIEAVYLALEAYKIMKTIYEKIAAEANARKL